jgi:hypothetical protein
MPTEQADTKELKFLEKESFRLRLQIWLGKTDSL